MVEIIKSIFFGLIIESVNKKPFLMRLKIAFSLFIIGSLFSSCAFMLHEMILPNQCQRCSIIDMQTNAIVYHQEGCGGEVAGMEESVKALAYDYINDEGYCDYQVICDTWTQEVVE